MDTTPPKESARQTEPPAGIGTARPKIVVLGGGFAGLESALYLRMKLREADVTLVSDREYFFFKPNAVYVPFGLDPNKLKFNLAPAAQRKHIQFKLTHAHEVDPISRIVETGDGPLPYDYLMVATGAGIRPAEVPGLAEHAHMIWGVEDMLKLRGAFNRLLKDIKDGQRQRVLFLVPPNNRCSGPLYEIVMMLDTWLRRKHSRRSATLAVATSEPDYFHAFGPQMHEVIEKEFEKRDVKGLKSHTVQAVEGNEALFTNGERYRFDVLVTLPPYVAGASFTNLPSDERGFIKVEMATRQVLGYPDVYALGDAADFPVKQAFLAFLQADAASEHLSSILLEHEFSSPFDPATMCIMEEYNPEFIPPPAIISNGSTHSIAGHTAENGTHSGRHGPEWHLGKMMIGVYLPWRFKAGNPFHAGLAWKGMEMGLKTLSGALR